MRKTKSEGKTVGIFAISSQTVRNVLRISQCEKPQRISQCEISQCEKPQRISQCEKPHCEFGNAKNHSEFRNAKFRNAKNHSEFRNAKFRNAKNHSEFRNAKLVANLAANLAMRIFAKVLHFCVRQMNSVLWLENLAMRNSQCEVGKPHFAMPNGCQLIANCLRKFMFCFFSSDFQYMLQNLHKTSKIKAIKIA